MSNKRRPYSSLRRRFDIIWLDLELIGGCDSIDGAEYQRVYREWRAAGCPLPIIRFIRLRSNIGPSPFSGN